MNTLVSGEAHGEGTLCPPPFPRLRPKHSHRVTRPRCSAPSCTRRNQSGPVPVTSINMASRSALRLSGCLFKEEKRPLLEILQPVHGDLLSCGRREAGWSAASCAHRLPGRGVLCSSQKGRAATSHACASIFPVSPRPLGAATLRR